MQHSYKVFLNTLASFSRVLLNIVVTLISTRLVLKVLGAEDFGLYNLLAGTVMLLSFVNGALMVSAQRYFSIAIGENDLNKLNKYYNASLSIHIILGLLIIIVLFIIRNPLFNGFLNIATHQVQVGLQVYDIMILTSAVTIITIPYSAIMNAYEDIVVMSFADIVSSLIKLFAALILLFVNKHILLTYSVLMLFASFVKALIEYAWSKAKYSEAIKGSLQRMTDISVIKQMFGFVGWNTLGSSAVLIRNQGVAIILNVFFGTLVNSAYGIANQVNSLVLSFASTLTNVFSPIIIRLRGENNDDRMKSIALFSSKLSFLLSSMLALPILLMLRPILDLWLGSYPNHTIDFCFYIILSFLVLQLYPGVNRSIYASGKIKGYQIAIFLLLTSILPIGVWLYNIGMPSYSIMIVMVASQIGTLFATIYYAVKHCGFQRKELYKDMVLMPCLIFCVIWVFLTFIINMFVPLDDSSSALGTLFLIIIIAICSELIYIPLYYKFCFNRYEKQMIQNLFCTVKLKFKNK